MSTGIDLAGVHPDLVWVWRERIAPGAAAAGFAVAPVQGLRTAEVQAALYAQGRDARGVIVDRARVVTYADGINNRSNHQAHEDGWGHALDFAFLVGGRLVSVSLQQLDSWEARLPWRMVGEMGKAWGLRWGGDFKIFRRDRWEPRPDLPHLELPRGYEDGSLRGRWDELLPPDPRRIA